MLKPALPGTPQWRSPQNALEQPSERSSCGR
jgi:hypothetical protein